MNEYKGYTIPHKKAGKLKNYPSSTIKDWFIENGSSNSNCLVGKDIVCGLSACQTINCDECLFSIRKKTKDVLLEYLIENNHIQGEDALQLTFDIKFNKINFTK